VRTNKKVEMMKNPQRKATNWSKVVLKIRQRQNYKVIRIKLFAIYKGEANELNTLGVTGSLDSTSPPTGVGAEGGAASAGGG
jgi:hypothetical protein